MISVKKNIKSIFFLDFNELLNLAKYDDIKQWNSMKYYIYSDTNRIYKTFYEKLI